MWDFSYKVFAQRVVTSSALIALTLITGHACSPTIFFQNINSVLGYEFF